MVSLPSWAAATSTNGCPEASVLTVVARAAPMGCEGATGARYGDVRATRLTVKTGVGVALVAARTTHRCPAQSRRQASAAGSREAPKKMGSTWVGARFASRRMNVGEMGPRHPGSDAWPEANGGV